MITNEEFIEATKKFDEIEKRGSFYNMAVDLIKSHFEIEAYFLILATWNFARFRYAAKDFNINSFKEKIMELNTYFEPFKNETFRTINFDRYKDHIKTIYEVLSSFEGIKYTGASKIMHLKNRAVFVMWDGYIKGNKAKKDYQKLDIVQKGDWEVPKYGNSAKEYIRFLMDMQNKFKNISFQDDNKTFAKAIDEFNYVKITLPIQDMEKDKKNKKGQGSRI